MSVCDGDDTVFQATLFQTLPLQQVDAQVTSASSQQSSQVVTDVIQQLLELSDPGPADASPAAQPGQQLSITVGISQDILQVRRITACLGPPTPAVTAQFLTSSEGF